MRRWQQLLQDPITRRVSFLEVLAFAGQGLKLLRRATPRSAGLASETQLPAEVVDQDIAPRAAACALTLSHAPGPAVSVDVVFPLSEN